MFRFANSIFFHWRDSPFQNQRLRRLFLQDNLISTLEDGCFINLHNHLQWLDLSYNRLQMIPMELTRLTALKVLNLSYNLITILDLQDTEMTNLQQLLMEGNYLHAIAMPTVISFRRLHTLSLTLDARDTVRQLLVDRAQFRHVTRLTVRHSTLEDNETTATLLAEWLNTFNDVERLTFSNNSLDPQHVLTNVTNVHRMSSLVVSDNNLQVYPELMFQHKVRLSSIDISHNDIVTLDRQYSTEGAARLPTSYKLITEISASHNQISTITESFAQAYPRLRNLDLRYNSLTTLGQAAITWSPTLVFHLSDNLWHCDCNLDSLWKALRQDTFTISHYDRVHGIRCSSPRVLSGMRLDDLTGRELLCGTYRSHRTHTL